MQIMKNATTIIRHTKASLAARRQIIGCGVPIIKIRQWGLQIDGGRATRARL